MVSNNKAATKHYKQYSFNRIGVGGICCLCCNPYAGNLSKGKRLHKRLVRRKMKLVLDKELEENS